MRRLCYQVACSLDGYIAGPQGEFDWIVADPDIDFQAIYDQFDTLLMGRKTFEQVGSDFQGKEVIVFSRHLSQADFPNVRIVADGIGETIDQLKSKAGRDIWLFGGGELFRSLLELGCVDTVETAIIPILLGGGLPLLPPTTAQTKLALAHQQVYEKSGIVLLSYELA